MSVPVFVDLTEVRPLKTPSKDVSHASRIASTSSSGLRASRAFTYLSPHRRWKGAIEVDGEMDFTSDCSKVFTKPAPAALSFERPESPITPRNNQRPTFSPQSGHSSFNSNSSDTDDVEILTYTPTRRKKGGSLPAFSPKRNRTLRSSFNTDGFVELPFSRLNIQTTTPSPKRRCSGLNRSSIPTLPTMLTPPTTQPLHGGKDSNSADEEDNVIDLTIQGNFPVQKSAKTIAQHETLLASAKFSHRTGAISLDDYLPHEVTEEEICQALVAFEIGPDQPIYVSSFQVQSTRTSETEYQKGNSRFKPGKSVELDDGKFLRIVSIFKDQNGAITLSGDLLCRQNSCGLLMPKRRNELVWIVEMSSEDFESGRETLHTEVPLSLVKRIRDITFTNQKFPEMSLRKCKDSFRNVQEETAIGPLFCRWKHLKVINNRKQRYEDCLTHLTYAQADLKPKARITPSLNRQIWRGSETILGGSHFEELKTRIDLDVEKPGATIRAGRIQRYTFGDAFCGAGGCSRGALQADLYVNWGFDIDKEAMESFRANFARGGTECLQEAVDEFCGRHNIQRFMVDILHMSPPCQPFSPAHTVPSEEQDAINQAALFSVWHLLERIKPRVATIEETEGLVSRHNEWFSALLNIFISHGYSVRWKVVRCDDYGVPQQRKRLFIIAAG